MTGGYARRLKTQNLLQTQAQIVHLGKPLLRRSVYLTVRLPHSGSARHDMPQSLFGYDSSLVFLRPLKAMQFS